MAQRQVVRWTDAKIAAAKLGEDQVAAGVRDQRISLGGGLYLRITATNAGLSKVFEYRAAVGSVRKFIALGAYQSGHFGLHEANEKCAALRAQAARARVGEAEHPVIAERYRREQRVSDPTVKALFDIWMADLKLGTPRTGGRPVRDRTVENHTRNFEVDIEPRIGDAKASQLQRAAVEDCIDRVRRRGAPGQAAQVYRTLRGLTRFAQRKGYLATDPMIGVDNPKPYNPQRSTVIAASDAELLALYGVLDDSRISHAVRLAVELSLLTGARPGEIRLANRTEFDLKRSIWTLPAERVKSDREFRIHLSKEACAIVTEAMRLPSEKGYLFSGRDGGPLEKMAVARALSRIAERTVERGGRKLRPHDLRRTFRTLLSRLQVPPHVAELTLNHQDKNVLARVYDGHDYKAEMAEAWDKAGAHIASLRAGGARVIPIQKHRA